LVDLLLFQNCSPLFSVLCLTPPILYAHSSSSASSLSGLPDCPYTSVIPSMSASVLPKCSRVQPVKSNISFTCKYTLTTATILSSFRHFSLTKQSSLADWAVSFLHSNTPKFTYAVWVSPTWWEERLTFPTDCVLIIRLIVQAYMDFILSLWEKERVCSKETREIFTAQSN
jgi:hypothetical protein